MLSLKWGLFSSILAICSERRQVGLNKGNGVITSNLSPQPQYEWIRGNSCSLRSLSKVMQGFHVTWHSQCLGGQPNLFLMHFQYWECSPSFSVFSQTCHYTLEVPQLWLPELMTRPPSPPSSTPTRLLLLSHYKAVIYCKMTEEAQRQIGGWRKALQRFTCRWSCKLTCRSRTTSRRWLLLIGSPGPVLSTLSEKERGGVTYSYLSLVPDTARGITLLQIKDHE